MTDVEILQECRMAALEERVIARQIERLAMAGGPRRLGSVALEIGADRKTNNSQAAQAQQLEGLIDTLIRKRDENIRIIERAEKVIGGIRERRDRIVIRCYYVEGESEYEIADEMDMSRQWVNQRRNRLIDELAGNKKRPIAKDY